MVTNALRQAPRHGGVSPSESMLFGVASGPAFACVNLTHSPMMSGRGKPLNFERKLTGRMNIAIRCPQPRDGGGAFTRARQPPDSGVPVPFYVDMPYLSRLGLPPDGRDGGHAVVAFGYDDMRLFYVSDGDSRDRLIPFPRGDLAEHFHLVLR